ncbi:MAG: TolC family protein [Candidatus Omnitrophica bacterium]|nr:TolC family protein [Candidatus Omnitrophota bacterium]MCG2705546.1 TolC family protein [Candidatus Omnitrophota bacterium]
MKKKHGVQLSLCVLLFSMLACVNVLISYAEEPPLSLRAAIDEALRANPEILAAKKNYEAAKTKVSQELMPDDPTAEFIYDKMRAGVPGVAGKGMKSWAISQKMPFPTKLLLRSQIASKDAKISYENYREKERGIIARVKSAYFEIWYLEKAEGVTDENKAILEQFARSAAARYSVNKGSQQDVLKADVEIAKVDNSLILLDQKLQIAKAKLNILLNKDPDEGLRIEDVLERKDVAESISELFAAAKEYRPKLRAFQYAVERGKTAYMLAWNEFLPDLSGKFEQMIASDASGRWKGMLGVSIPIWFMEKQVPGVREKQSELDMIRADYNTMENMALFEVKYAYAEAESYKKLVETFETSFIPQAEQALKASLTGYEAGQVDFLNLLDSQRMFLDIKLDYYKTIFELETAKADLEEAVGTDLWSPADIF